MRGKRYYEGFHGGWAPYVPVAERRRNAEKEITALQKKGKTLSPIRIAGRSIARTFWGKSWCNNLEVYSDFSNRLPRGRTYLRNGSVIDLQIDKSIITAMVSGSSIYHVEIKIHKLEPARWKSVIEHCSGQINSLVELLQGKFSQAVMEVITCQKRGLFPSPKQISMNCSCPDGAVMCKHVAAVLYGVGARLDENPELFFVLRNVDHAELITAAVSTNTMERTTQSHKVLKTPDLSGIFGIELDEDSTQNEGEPKGISSKKKSKNKKTNHKNKQRK